MIKCKVIEQFDLKVVYKLKNIKRKGADMKGRLFVGDSFECDEKMADYLTGNNVLKKTVVKVVEVEPKKAIVKTDSMAKEIFNETPIIKEKPKKNKTSKK